MAANKLTAFGFKNLKASEKEQLVSDGNNLYVSIRAQSNGGGSKSFRMTYRIGSKKQWITLKAKTLSDARVERDSYQALVKKGIDPGLERKLVIERQRAAQLAEQMELAKQQALISVANLFERWVNTDLLKRKDLAEIRRMFDKDVLPILGSLVVVDVRKSHIMEIMDMLKQRDAKHLARNVLKLMRQMFRFAVDREIIELDPTAKLSITKTTTKPTERDRTLSDIEIRALARQLPDANLLKSTECAIWIALSTMCRIGELSKAQFSHIDFEAKIWKIPETNSKNGKAHTIYLSDFALKQFERLAAIRQFDTWIFSNRHDSSHVCEKSISIQIRGRQTTTILSNRSKDSQALVLTGGKWTPHDLIYGVQGQP
ncbi:MAG: tyrosine-type recombinase/integrase [Methylococcales bacterium]|nr:tyrosine-type recombinase/integrase [Methylococcales bacterium]